MKEIWKSKTFWVGIISVIIGILQYVQGNIDTGSAITIEGIIMIVLRYVTEGKVVFGKIKRT